MTDVRMGIIGCGRIVQGVHLPILTRLPGVQVVALAESDPRRLDDARRLAPRADTHRDGSELVEKAEVHAVLIAVPNALHAETAIAAMSRGKQVYLEKPLAMNTAEGRRVLTAWRSAGVAGMIGFNYRFNPLHAELRRQLQSGRIGELVGARSVFSTSAAQLPEWKRTRAGGGGVLLDLASHHADLFRFLWGQDVREVSATVRSLQSEDDTATLRVQLADGLTIESFFSLCSVEEDRFEVYGRSGKLSVDRYHSWNVEYTAPHRRGDRWRRLRQGLSVAFTCGHALRKLRSPGYEPSYRAALTHFVEAVRTNRPPSPDLLDGYRSLALIEAAEESARTGRAVCPAEPESAMISEPSIKETSNT